MSISAQLIDQRVEGVLERIGERLRNEVRIKNDPDRLRSAAFVFLVAQTVTEFDDDQAVDGLVEGGGDFGIDAIYFGAPEDNEFPVVLIQGKYKRSLDAEGTFPESGVEKMLGAVRTIFDPGCTYTANDRLKKRVEELRSLIREGNIPSVRIILCNNGREWNSSCQQRIDAFGFRSLVKWEYAGPDELIGLLRKKKDVQTRIQLSGRALVEDYAFMRAMVGRMSVSELARLLDEHGDALLDRNIRRYLGLSVLVNERIAETLKDPERRGKFYFYNNGITIVCSRFSYNALAERDWIVQVTGLNIVNGGQTSKTIQQIQREVGSDIATAQIMVRIYELPVDDESLVQRITEATNSQSPVDLRDLRSNDPRQRDLSDSIGMLGFAYRRQRVDTPLTSKDITSAQAAEAVLSVWRHRPHLARLQMKDYFGRLYDLIFTADLNGAQVVTAVLLLRIAENKRKQLSEEVNDYLQYGARHAAMLMGEDVLKNAGIGLSGLNHRSFSDVAECIEKNGEMYFQRAMTRVGDALKSFDSPGTVSLQQLSAVFRRVDLVEVLREGKMIAIGPDQS